MPVYKDTYTYKINFGDENTVTWSECSQEWVDNVSRLIVEQGPPFVPDDDGSDNGFNIIVPEKVLWVGAYRTKANCPVCNHRGTGNYDCGRPEYHDR